MAIGEEGLPSNSSLTAFSPFLQAFLSEMAQASKSLSFSTTLLPGQEAAMESPMTPTPQPESRMEEAEQIVSSWAISFNSSLVPVSMS